MQDIRDIAVDRAEISEVVLQFLGELQGSLSAVPAIAPQGLGLLCERCLNVDISFFCGKEVMKIGKLVRMRQDARNL